MNVKAILGKVWKDESLSLTSGKHHVDDVLTVRIFGTVEKRADTEASPTVSIPLIPTLALFWEKSGITRDAALNLLREAITEAIQLNDSTDGKIAERMNDVQKAVDAIRKDLLAKLPKAPRAGSTITKNVSVEVVSMAETVAEEVAA